MATVEVGGEQFELSAGEFPVFAQMELAGAIADAAEGDAAPGAEAAASLRLLEACVTDGAWPKLRKKLRRMGATELAEVTLRLVESRMEQSDDEEDALPTGAPSVSSDGRTVIEQKSVSSSVVKASDRWAGRPDLRMIIEDEKAAASA